MKFQFKSRAARVATLAGAATLVAATLTVGAGAGAAVKAHVSYAKTLACEVTDTGGINDKSFNASAYAGLQAAGKLSKNISLKWISTPSNGTESTYDTEISSLVSQHCNIIVTVGFLMSDATWNAVNQNPSIHFAQVDNSNSNPGSDGVNLYPNASAPKSNYLGLTYSTQQDAFLGGYEAAAYAAAKNPSAPKVATFGGMQFSSVTYYMDGFYDGVQYYNSTAKPAHNVTVLGWNEKTQTGDFVSTCNPNNPFGDQTCGASMTNTYLGEGATTIFPVAGSVGQGTTSAVKTWNASHSIKANVEWVDTDGCVSDATDCSVFLNSITKGVTASVLAAITAQATGNWGNGGNYVGTLANGGAAFVQDNGLKNFFSAAQAAKIATAVKTITSGIESKKITVAVGS